MYGTETESLTRGHVSCLCAWLLKYIVYAWGEKKKEALHLNINRVYFGASTTADFSVIFKSIAKLDWI